MKKLFIVALTAFLLTGCKFENKVDLSDNWSERDFTVVCLSGVEYYIRAIYGKAYMAVKIDKDTLHPVRCNL